MSTFISLSLCIARYFILLAIKKLKIGRCIEKHVLHINTEISIEIARRETKHGLEQTLHCVQQTH